MRALIKTEPGAGHLSVTDAPTPSPGPGEALVRIHRSGLCGTDLLLEDDVYRGRKRPVPYPLIPGHEAAGEVTELGPRTSGPAVGTRVAIEAVTGCGACFHCGRGDYNLCQDWHHIGLTIDGAFAEYVAVPASSLVPLPDTVSLDNAAFLGPLATAIQTLERTHPAPRTPVVILGPGPLGLLHVQVLRASGIGPIIVFGLPGDEARLDLALRVGATEALVLDRAGANAWVSEFTGGVGMGLVVETAGTSGALQTALDITAGQGTLATLGIVQTTQIDALQVIRKNMTWVGVVASVRRHWEEAIRLIAAGRVDPTPLITRRLLIDQALDGFAAVRRRTAVKVMFSLADG